MYAMTINTSSDRLRRKALAEQMDFASFRELGLAYETAEDQENLESEKSQGILMAMEEDQEDIGLQDEYGSDVDVDTDQDNHEDNIMDFFDSQNNLNFSNDENNSIPSQTERDVNDKSKANRPLSNNIEEEECETLRIDAVKSENSELMENSELKENSKLNHGETNIFDSQDNLNFSNDDNNAIPSHHSSEIHNCDKCEYQSKSRAHLKVHIKTVHEGVQHSCDQCDYKTARLDNLKTHIKVKHKGIKHICDICGYQATRPDYLKIHKNTKH